MSVENGHDLHSAYLKIEERLGEVESHIPRIGGCEAHEIALSANVAQLHGAFALLRAEVYRFAGQAAHREEVADHRMANVEKLLSAIAAKVGVSL